jgi:hypothetical protein
MSKFYTITAYLGEVKIGSGTVIEDHPVFHLVSQANEWFGKDNWGRFEITFYKESK